MLVTLVVPESDLFLPQEIDPSIQVSDVLMVLCLELSVDEDQIILHHDGRPVDLGKTFKDLGIKDGDMLVVSKKSKSPSQPAQASSSQAASAGQVSDAEAEQFRQYILSDESFRQKLMQIKPDLLEAALENSADFKPLLEKLQSALAAERNYEAEKARLYSEIARDPFNVEAQRKIEELIQEENINQNMHNAMEFHPESFGVVHMLYINSHVNGVHVKAFVDCGAQTSFMSKRCAERCGITRLIDTRYSGIAQGVGQGKILGRVHSVVIKIGSQHLACSLSILDSVGPEFLFGLDMLKRHQILINLREDRLEIGGEHISFLAEHEITKEL